MLRDFSQENLNAFNQFVRTASPDKNDQIAKLAESLISKYQTQLSRIGGIAPVRAIASANNETGSLIRMSDSKVQRTFTAVTAQDAQFPLDTQDALTAVKEAMNALEEVNNAGSNAVNKGLKLWDAFNPDAIQEVTASSNEKLKAKEAELEDKLQANNVTNSEGDPDEIVEEIDFDIESMDSISDSDKPTFSNRRFQELVDGVDKKGNPLNKAFGVAQGKKKNMTNEDWQEYAKALIYLEKQNRLQYGSEHTPYTSAKMDKGVVYADCYGILYIGACLTLNKSGMQKQYFSSVNNMATHFQNKKTLKEVKKKDGLDVNQLTKHDDTYVFINNDINKGDEKEGYDHVYKVVKDLQDKDDPNKVHPIGLLSIGGPDIGLQTYDAEEWYEKNKNYPIAYGTQKKYKGE